MYVGLLSLLLLVGLQFRQAVVMEEPNLAAFQLPDYQTQLDEFGVLQLTNAKALVYIKPPVRAFQGGHDPRICWQGSGYEFTKIDTLQIENFIIYQAVLEKEDDTLHTAWWYAGGAIKTVSEWEWRWATLRQQERFHLVNVTAATEEELYGLVASWLNTAL
jgi:exosortase N